MPNGPWGTSTSNAGATPSVTPIGSQGSIDTINSADILSRDRKPDLIAQVRKELQDQTQLDAQASALGVSASAYDTSVSALMTFLNGLAPVRTNWLKRSHEIGTSPWAQTNGGTGTAVVYTQNYAAAPDGTTTATRLQANRGAGNTASDYSVAIQGSILTGDGTTARTESIWLKSNTGAPQKVYFGANGSGSVVDVTTTWQRFTRTYTPANGLAVRMDIGSYGAKPTGTNSVDVLIWGGQYEDGASATSNIVTGAAAVTEGGWSDLGSDSDMGASGDITLRANLQAVATARAALEKALGDKIQANAAYADALARSSNNLIKNPSCLDTAASSSTPEGYGLGNLGATYSASIGTPTAPNGWSRWLKTLGAGVAVYGYLTKDIPCENGYQYRLEAYATKVLNNSGTAYIGLEFKAASGAVNVQSATVPNITSWAAAPRLVVDGVAPNNIGGSPVISVRPFIQITGDGTYNEAAFNQFYLARKISAGLLEADLGIFGVIRSGGGPGTGDYVAGSAGNAPQGFKFSGVPFTSTLKDGSTFSAQAEFGRAINIGGFKVGDQVDRTMAAYNRILNGQFYLDLTNWTGGNGSVPVTWDSNSSTTGGGCAVITATGTGAPQVGRITQSFNCPPTTATVNLTLSSAITSVSGLTTSGSVKAYLFNTATGTETLVATWSYAAGVQPTSPSWTSRTVDVTSIVSGGGDFVLQLLLNVQTNSADTAKVYVDNVKITI